MVYITTEYRCDINGNGYLLVRSSSGRRMRVSWDHRLGTEENHDAAARAMCVKYDWHGKLAVGSGNKGNAYCFIEAGRILTIGLPKPAKRMHKR